MKAVGHIAFIRYLTSSGLRTLYNSPETATQWKYETRLMVLIFWMWEIYALG